MRHVLNFLYVALLVALSPWLFYQALVKGKYREGYGQKLLGRVPWRTSGGRCVWMHAVSVGEVNLLAPLVEEVARHRPDWQCVVSTTTATGYALAKTRFPSLTVFYCPLDFTWAVRTAMRRIRPDLLVLAELELWPNLIAAAKTTGAQVAVVNGRLGERSHRGYRFVRPLMRRLLAQVDLVAAQNDTFADRFRDLGAPHDRVHVTGSIKFDGAETDRRNAKTRRLRDLAGIADGDIVFLAGSTQDPEERLALDTFRRLVPRWPNLRLILVPRHPDRFDAVATMLDDQSQHGDFAWQRRSLLGRSPADPEARVLLVDSIGELGAWWGTADVAFVGGSMGDRGGQNMIEPAAYGAAICFGPNTWNFRDIVALMLRAGAAEVVHDGEALTRFVREMLENPAHAATLGRHAAQLVLSQQGATARTAVLLESLLGSPPASRRQAA
jgi:3-deoxy-D-manno-octulosonic-acid transferase